MSSGTLHTPHSAYDTKRGDTIKYRVLSSHILLKSTKKDDTMAQISKNVMKNVEYDTARMRSVLSKHLRLRLHVLFYCNQCVF